MVLRDLLEAFAIRILGRGQGGNLHTSDRLHTEPTCYFLMTRLD